MKNQFRARYILRNPQKYIGNSGQVIARSRWELNVMRFFDLSTGVVKWASEEFSIPYVSPKDGRIHKYFPDFYLEYQHKSGTMMKEIVEVKPLHESKEEHTRNDIDRLALAVNQAKWAAATAFAHARGLTFRVITEMSIFKTPPKTKTPKKVKPKVAPKRPRGPK